MADPDRRGGGGGLSLRTLAIASASSLTAAMVTSRLFPPGTIYASALTPVLVAAVGELLQRPANRVSELREQRRTMVLESRRMETTRMVGQAPLRGAPDFALGADAEAQADANGHGGAAGPRRVDRARAPADLARRREPATGELRIHGRRRLHPRVWIATGVAAFAIAAAALTLPELIFGGAVATQKRTTLFGGGDKRQRERQAPAPSEAEQQPETVTETAPAQTPGQATDTTTTETAPSGGATAPTETTTTDTGTGTATTTTPGGVLPPVP